MSDVEESMSPRPIISLMFGVSVGFWASQLATFIQDYPKSPVSPDIVSLDTVSPDTVSPDTVSPDTESPDTVSPDIDSPDTASPDNASPDNASPDTASPDTASPDTASPDTASPDTASPDTASADTASPDTASADIEHRDRVIIWWIKFISAVLFLLDLLCIVWWYARYIYRIQPRASFGTHFLDFVICSMFALAANSWTKHQTFLIATACASGFLLYRFWLLFRGSDASLADRHILFRASVLLMVSLSLVAGVVMVDHWWVTWFDLTPFQGAGLPGVLSLIGILLTLYLRSKIDVAVDIYAARHASISPAYLAWPEEGSPTPQERNRIRERTKAGLEGFDKLFSGHGKHDRIHSRVHSETDLRVQSYILAVPSCHEDSLAQEIEKKAFMVALTHWLDDLVDGRAEPWLWKRIHSGPNLSSEDGPAQGLFEHLYRPLVVKHTDAKFYDELLKTIASACLFPYNLPYVFLGLNRIAYGATIFSPRLVASQRREILDRHNVFLKVWNVEGDPFTNAVEKILDDLVADGDAGSVLLGLTTKTVQEVAMSGESQELNVGLSILYSLLYAPLIYFHNIGEELQSGEMVPLQSFDTDVDLWSGRLSDVRKAIRLAPDDGRQQLRDQQIAMAYRCFERMLPPHITDALRPIYLSQGDKAPNDP